VVILELEKINSCRLPVSLYLVGSVYFFFNLGWEATHDGKSVAESIDGE